MEYLQITRLLLSTIPRPWGTGVSKNLQETWKPKYFILKWYECPGFQSTLGIQFGFCGRRCLSDSTNVRTSGDHYDHLVQRLAVKGETEGQWQEKIIPRSHSWVFDNAHHYSPGSRQGRGGAVLVPLTPCHSCVSRAGFGPVSGRTLDRDFGLGEEWQKLSQMSLTRAAVSPRWPKPAPLSKNPDSASPAQGQEHGSGHLPEENS